MLTATVSAAPTEEPQASEEQPRDEHLDQNGDVQMKNVTKEEGAAFLHSPPDSHDAPKSDATDSELSDLEDEPVLDDALPPATTTEANDTKPAEKEDKEDEDIGEVLPADWSGAVPIFRPTMHQFKDFQKFMAKVDCYGMKSGIIKIIPPPEWKNAQPPLDDLVKQVRVREPIKQDIMGSNGTYRQVNILHGRSYNVPQWRQLCDQSEHQPPAKRGERRANTEKRTARSKPAAAPKSSEHSAPKKRGKGRPARGRGGGKVQAKDVERPMTPVSPKLEASEGAMASIEKDPGDDIDDDDEPSAPRRMGGVKPAKPAKTTSVSARRKYVRREGSAMIDEEAFKNFDYKMDVTEYTPERCEELERSYWKTLTYAQPLYGADMMGTLFDDRTDIWNLNKLPNILDVLGSKVPGVNTAYLYLGMWKATFAWHLEDVDLYSINYLHFGAPKQWYSISQADARRFEGAMKNIWPADAKACPQFLRHKGFLISPQHLLQNYNIKVNKVVSYPGEFVVTYPYGYHSGYNLGYNCAEAVNFALEPWLEMGKIAKKCECAQAQDSVWIDVHAIERKLRGWETEYEETDEEEEEDSDEDDEDMTGMPTPPTNGVKFKTAPRKRKRAANEKGERVKVKKIKLKLKNRAEPPCCLCPNDYPGLDLLTTDDGRKAHRTCALYIPETFIDTYEGEEVVCGTAHIHKDRLNLKCLFCRSKRGACFQCSQKKCARAYHASCAAAAGVFVEEQDVPVFGEDGTEYKEQAFEFSCRFHRTRRDRKLDSLALEESVRIRDAATDLKVGEMCQMQFLKGEIFAGLVVENRADEHMLVIDTVPHGQRLEVEYKWLLLADPSDYHLPKASANAIPMPVSQKAKDKLNAKRADDKPRKDDIFAIGYTWAEYHEAEVSNPGQVKVDLSKPDQLWYYLGKTSTEAKAQYTEDPRKPRHNTKGNFLDTVPKPPPKQRPVATTQMQYRQHQFAQTGLPQPVSNSYSAAMLKPYAYKPREGQVQPQAAQYTNQQFSAQALPPQAPAPKAAPTAPPTRVWNNYSGSFAQSKQPKSSQQTYQTPAQRQAQPVQQQQTYQPVHQPQQLHQAQSKPTYQIHPGIYQKYPFYQQHYNRDTSKYRSPYSSAGGFTNGWEVNPNMRSALAQPAYQQQQQQQQQQHSGAPPAPKPQGPTQVPSARPTPSNPAQAALTATKAASRPQSTSSQTHNAPSSQTWKPPQPAKSQTPAASPAANAHVTKTPSSQKSVTQGSSSLPFKSTKPAAASAAPVKQSPVPLPSNFLAARTTTPSASASPTAMRTGGPPISGKITSHTPIPPPAARVAQQNAAASPETAGQQRFPDVPGGGSMEFVERLMGNLRRASQRT